MTALLLHGLADLFTVGHARGVELGVHAEAGLELAHEHVDLNVARAGDDHLMGLGVVDDGKGRVFLVQTVEAGAELFLLAAGLGRDGAGVAGLGVGHTRQLDDALRVAEGVAGLNAVHLGDGADVAAADLLDLLVLLALEGVETAELFGVAGGGVVEGHIAGDLAADDLDQRELAVLVGNGLEDDGGGGTVFIVGDLNGVAVVVLRGLGGHIGGDGNEITLPQSTGATLPSRTPNLRPLAISSAESSMVSKNFSISSSSAPAAASISSARRASTSSAMSAGMAHSAALPPLTS